MRIARRVAVALLLVGATFAGVAAAGALTPQGPPPTDAEPSVSAALEGSDSLDATAPDPDGGPSWVVARFVNENGRECAAVGRLVAGRFGRVQGDGRFQPLGVGPGGVCGDAKQEFVHAIGVYPGDGSREARTILFGIAGSVVPAMVLAPDGSRHRLTRGARGGFLVVMRGQSGLSDWRLGPAARP